MLALVTCHISPLNLIRKKINSWHLASRLTARSLSELDRECILGNVFFSLRGGGRVRVRVRCGRRQVKIEFELLWGEFEREFELCHRQFELEFEHVDRESGRRKLVFFFRGGCEFEFEFDADAVRSKSSSNCSGASSNASSNCVTASSNSSSSMWTASPDSESLVFFSGGGSSSSSSSTRTPLGQNRVWTALGRVRTTVSPPVRTRVRSRSTCSNSSSNWRWHSSNSRSNSPQRKSSSNCSGASSNATASPDAESLFFFSRGGCEFEFDADAVRSKSSSNCSGASSNASSNCVTASSNSSSSMWTASPDSESLVFFPGGVRVRVRAGLTMNPYLKHFSPSIFAQLEPGGLCNLPPEFPSLPSPARTY